MECYYYKTINELDDAILSNIDLTIVLMMDNSSRFKYDPFLLSLSKKTIIQYNKGFKNCNKLNITNSTEDINHAYYNAFMYSKSFNNVLIIEEDAEILNTDLKHYKIIDDYLNGTFKVLSFGTNGIFKIIDKNFYKVDVPHGAQAQVFSKEFRNILIKDIKNNNFKGEIDTTYLCGSVVTVYNFPLIVQKFPETENFNNWSGNKFLNKLGIKTLDLDNSLNGWYIIHLISKIRGISKIIFLSLIIMACFIKLQKFMNIKI